MKPRIPTRGGRIVAIAAAGLLVGGMLSTGVAQASAPAAAAASTAPGKDKANRSHTPKHPLPIARKQAALKDAAAREAPRGRQGVPGQDRQGRQGPREEATSSCEREGTDPVFVILVEFGDAQYPNPSFQGPPRTAAPPTSPARCTTRSRRRTAASTTRTLWQADYNVAHYQNMYFNRMAKYYETQSSGRYSVEGDVNGWVKVPFNEALYGRNYCGDIVCNTTQALVRDAMAVWVKQQLDRGKTIDADRRLPQDLRRLGPLRPRRRRQLQRAGRLHRPHPDRPRGRRRGGRRPEPGHRRHLEPPLVRRDLQAGGPVGLPRRRTSAPTAASSSSTDDPEQPDRRLGRRLHDAARERRPGRLRPRVRPRPRPAGPLRHLRQHRRRRELHRRSGP